MLIRWPQEIQAQFHAGDFGKFANVSQPRFVQHNIESSDMEEATP